MRLTPLVAVALLPTSLAAQAALRPTVTTVAGVEQVKYAANALAVAPRFRLATAPMATMGGLDAPLDAEVTSATSPRFLPDGRIVAMDRKEFHLLLFGGDGKLVRTIGQKGSGPGEYQSPFFGIALAGDTIISGDLGNNRLMLLKPDQRLPTEYPFEIPGHMGLQLPVGSVQGRLAFVPGGWRLVPNDSTHRPLAPVTLVQPGVSKVDTVFMATGPLMTNIEMVFNNKPRRQTIVTTFASADVVVAGRGGFVVAPSGGFELDYRDAKGKLTRKVLIPLARRPVTPTVIKEWVEAEAQRQMLYPGEGDVVAKPDRALIERNARFADSLPALIRLAPLPDGSVWALDYTVSDSSPWGATLFDPNGRIIGRVEGKGDAHPLAWARDRLLLASKDDDGIVTWRVFQLFGPH